MDKTSQKKQKLEVFKMAKNNVQKSFMMEQFSIGRSILYDILKTEKKLKKFKAGKEELSYFYLLYTAVILFYEKIFLYLSGKIIIRTCLQKNRAQHIRVRE